jgi:uncharacterized caspase-like protein
VGAASRDLSGQRRVALVIGNGAYQHLPRLENSVNDAQLIAKTLQSVGFQLVGGQAQTDLDRAGFERAIRQFGKELTGGSVGLFYYAGHGLQFQGANFLVPITANPATAADLDFEMIDANTALKQMEVSGSELNLVILDACRNNPFGGRGLRDAGQGLAVMRAPRGTLISYATQAGNVAMDGTTGHSPYTAALAETVRRPGLPVLEVFNEVGLSVDQATGGRQQPWVSSSPLERVFYFLGPTTVNITPPAPAQPSPEAETVFWQSVAQSSNPADFDEYLRQYPQGRFAGLAHNRLAALRPMPPTQAPTLQQHEAAPAAPRQPSLTRPKPNLYVLAIGVSIYKVPKLNTRRYAAKDAADIASALKNQEGKLYGRVEVKVLRDSEVSLSNITQGFDWIVQEATSRDVALVFMAGHLVGDEGKYYFLPSDVDLSSLRRTAEPETDINESLRLIAGKALFFFDGSGTIAPKQDSAAPSYPSLQLR